MTVISNEKLKQAILVALADKDMLNILNLAQQKLTSVSDVRQKYDISHTTAYRKINWMLENNLLVVKKMEFTDDGKKFSLFTSVISSIIIKYEQNAVTVEATKNVDVLQNITQKFFSLDEQT